MVSHHVPSQPDLPAVFESLNGDTLGLILKFVGDKSYRSFGGSNKHCKEIYITSGMAKETFVYGYGPLSVIKDRCKIITEDHDWGVGKPVGKGVVLFNRRDVLHWAIEEKNKQLLRKICNVAGEEGRVDVLNEIWENVEDEDDKDNVFFFTDYSAAQGCKLNVLKWLELKGLSVNYNCCASEAAKAGQLHILEWLRKDKGAKLSEALYNEAIDGNQMHVLKWLREKGVHWQPFTFGCAEDKGNLDILQYLHDEGCPSRLPRLSENELKPEVVDWLRANGYHHRIP